jgi:hypothetical protein
MGFVGVWIFKQLDKQGALASMRRAEKALELTVG